MAQKVRITSSYSEQQRQYSKGIYNVCADGNLVLLNTYLQNQRNVICNLLLHFFNNQENTPQPLNGGNRANTIICRNKRESVNKS